MYFYVFQELDQRYNALLMMYGEKVEEAQELGLDLQDVKDLYKTQVNIIKVLPHGIAIKTSLIFQRHNIKFPDYGEPPTAL